MRERASAKEGKMCAVSSRFLRRHAALHVVKVILALDGIIMIALLNNTQAS